MKEKIFQSLKQTFSSKYGVSDEVLQGYAKSLAATGLVNDENLATVIQGQETALRAFQQNFDRIRKEGSDYKKELDELKAKTRNPKPDPNPQLTPEEKPDMAKIIAGTVNAAVKPLFGKLTQFETEKAQATRQEQILAKAKEYGIPESQAKRYDIPDDADLDAYFKEVKQELTQEGFERVKTPDAGERQREEETSALAEMINDGAKELVELIMSAGFKYDLVPPVEQKERYDVQTGIRRHGPYKLDTANLVEVSFLLGFTLIHAGLKNKIAYPVRNAKDIEAYATDAALCLSRLLKTHWLMSECLSVMERKVRK